MATDSIIDDLIGSFSRKNPDDAGATIIRPRRDDGRPRASNDSVFSMNQNDYDISYSIPRPVLSDSATVSKREIWEDDSDRPTIGGTVDTVMGMYPMLPSPEAPVENEVSASPSAMSREESAPLSETSMEEEDSPSVGEGSPSASSSPVSSSGVDVPESTSYEDDNVIVDIPSRPEPKVRYLDVPGERFKLSENVASDSASSRVNAKGWDGRSISEKLVGSPEIPPNAVGISTDIVRSLVKMPGNNLLDIVREATGLSITPEQLMTKDGMRSFIDAVNGADIYITTTKSPTPDPRNVQGRRLIIVEWDRGVYLHPTQVTAFDADFDGDDVNVQFSYDPSLFRPAMSYLVSVDGQAMVDPDRFTIFPLDFSRDEYVDFIMENFLTEYTGVDDAKTKIAERLYDLNEAVIAGIEDTNDLWVGLFRSMQEMASRYSGNWDDIVSDIYRRVYDTMTLMRNLNIEDQLTVPYEGPVLSGDPANDYIAGIVRDSYMGVLPPNIYDFENNMNRFLGDVIGKNAEFRISSNIMKRIGASKRTFVGKPGMLELYSLTLDASMAMFCSGRIDMEDSLRNYKYTIRREVLRRVGTPGNPAYLKDGKVDMFLFLRTLKREFNHMMNIVDRAGFTYDCDMDVEYKSVKNRSIQSDYIEDMTDAILKIYGDMTMGEFFKGVMSFSGKVSYGLHFKGNTLLKRYEGMTLSEFAELNRVNVRRKDIEKKSIRGGKKRVKKKDGTFVDVDMEGKDAAAILVYCLADKRTSLSAKYSDELKKLIGEWGMGLKRIQFLSMKGRLVNENWRQYVGDILIGMHCSGPKMFSYYGMSNWSTFSNGKYGKMMREAVARYKDPIEALGGIRATMVFEYKMRNVSRIRRQINDLRGTGKTSLSNVERIHKLRNDLYDELEILSSGSDFWHVIRDEANGNGTAYDTLLKTRGECLKTEKTWWSDAKGFWRTSAHKYGSLTEVMSDPYVSWEDKLSISADVVRISTGFYMISRFEMNHQWEMGPDDAHSSLSHMSYRDQPDILSDIRKGINKIKVARELSEQSVTDEVRKLRAVMKPGELTTFISKLARNKQRLVEIDDRFFVDAILSLGHKTSRSSEKNKTERPVEAFYSATVAQDGGVSDEVQRSDDMTFGRIPSGSLSRTDLLRILSDPDDRAFVYVGDDVCLTDVESMCGSRDEDAIWDMLEANPRIAHQLKQHYVTLNGEDAFVSTRGSLADAVSAVMGNDNEEYEIAVSDMCKESTFAMLVSLFTPREGKTHMMAREECRSVMRGLSCLFLQLGNASLGGAVIDYHAVTERLGVTEAALLDNGLDARSVDQFIDDVDYTVEKMVKICSRAIESVGDKRFIPPSHKVTLRFDRASIRAANDTLQAFQGARIGTAIGVEGSMTRKYGPVDLMLMSISDKYDIVDSSTDPAVLEKLSGCETNVGPLDPSRIREMEDEAGDDPIVVLVPDGYEVMDNTLADDDRQVPSVARYFTVKRTTAAEKFAMKAKKSGRVVTARDVDPLIDMTFNILKHEHYDKAASDNIRRVESAYERSGSVFAARMEYAKILMSKDRKLGYDDMDLASYMCIADLCVREHLDEDGSGAVSIVTLSQQADAIRRGMPPDVVLNGTPAEKIAEASRIASEITGIHVPGDQARSFSQNAFASMRLHTNGQLRSSTYSSLSSKDRNFKQLWRLTAKNESISIPWSGEKFDKKRRMQTQTDSQLRKVSRANARSSVYDLDERSQYRFIGRCGPGFGHRSTIVPGMTSVVLIEPGATQSSVDEVLRECYAYGMTVAFDRLSVLGDKADYFAEDVTPAPFGSDLLMIPFFNIRLNGWSKSAPMAPASFNFDPSWIGQHVMDQDNLYETGDAQYVMSSRVDLNIADRGVEPIHVRDLFWNTYQLNPDGIIGIELASRDEQESAIVNLRDGGPIIDYGIAGSNRFRSFKNERLASQIKRYAARFSLVNEKGIMESSEPDEIVTWAKCFVKGNPEPIWAPVVPFPTGGKLAAPTHFNVDDVDIDSIARYGDIQVKWTLNVDPRGHVVKILHPEGASGKGVAMVQGDVDLGTLQDGTDITTVSSASSFSGRFIGTSRRMSTIKSMCIKMQMPPYGYNFFESCNAFPGESQFVVNEMRRTGYLSMSWWRVNFDDITKFHSDPEIDGFVRSMVRQMIDTGTTNPTDFLATKIDGRFSFRYIDWDFFIDPSPEFQNLIMKYFSTMVDAVPPNIYSYEEGKHLFKPLLSPDGFEDFEHGCLQMLVPYQVEGRGIVNRWSDVYVGFNFFTSDTTALHKVGVNGSHRTMEQLSSVAASGRMLSGSDMDAFASSMIGVTQGDIMRPGNFSIDFDAVLRKG